MIRCVCDPSVRERLHWRNGLFILVFMPLIAVAYSASALGQDEATPPVPTPVASTESAAVPTENGSASAGDTFNATEGVPYRRVYVPASDLNALQLQLPDYVPIDATELKELMKRHSDRLRVTSGSIDMGAELSFDSMHLVARLVGGDLVSTRSRLLLNRPYNSQTSFDGNRLTLKPWSMTFTELPADTHNGPVVASMENDSHPVWMLDSAGLPVVVAPKLEGNDAAIADSATNNQSGPARVPSNWFGWTLRSEPSSTANRLSYTMSVPRCPNGVLLLALPPSAQITECSGIARKYSQWNEALARLGEWPDTNVVSDRESLWGIELTGSEKISFSISLSSGVLERSLEEGLLYEYLVREQRTEHVLDQDTIRSISEIQLMNFEGTRGALRLTLPTNARVRKIQVDQQEVGFQFEEGLINVVTDVSGTDAKVSATKPKNIRSLRIELLTPLNDSKLASFDLPEPTVFRSYVMAGTSSISAVQPWRFSSVETLARRKSEKLDANAVNRVSQMEFGWSGKPAVVHLEATTAKRNGVAEVLNRLSYEESKQGITAYVRFNPVERSQPFDVNCRIDSAWNVESAVVTDPASGVTVSNVKTERGSIVHLESDQPLRDPYLQLELRLSRSESSVLDGSNASSPRIMTVDQWTQSDFFVVEQSGLLQFDIPNELVDSIVNEDALPVWQRERLPRLGRFILLRSVNGRLPTLGIIRSTNRIAATIRTAMSQQGTQLIARNTINARSPSGSFGNLIIDMHSEQVQWRVQSRGVWKSFEPQRGSTPTTWVVDNAILAASTVLEASVVWDLKDGNARLPMPKVANADETSYVVTSSPSLRLRGNTDDLQWNISEIGEVQLECKSNRDQNVVLFIEALNGTSDTELWLSNFLLDVSVDGNGNQLASVRLRNDHSHWNGLTFRVPAGWRATSARWHGKGGRDESLSFETRENEVLFLNGQLNSYGPGELDVILVGPELSPIGASQRNFNWPAMEVGLHCLERSRRLWLPKDISISSDSQFVRDTSPWLVWNWWARAQRLVIGLDARDERRSELQMQSRFEAADTSAIQDDRLIRGHWRIAHAESLNEISIAESNDVESQTIVLVTRGSQTTWLVLAFAVSLLLTPRILGTRRWIGIVCAVVVVVGAHWPAGEASALFQFTLFGMCLGYALTIVYQLTCIVRDHNHAVHKHTTKWIPWNDPRSNAPPSGNPLATEVVQRSVTGSLFLGFLLGSGLLPIILSVLIGAVSVRDVSGQRDGSTTDGIARIHQVLIPVDEQGNLSGTECFVPKGLLSLLKDDVQVAPFADSETHLLSAKHALRIDSRSGPFGTNDQLVQNYEMWIGDSLQPIRFPMSNEQSRFARFVVDGMEVTVGSRLRKTEPELLWFPEKPGKRLVQIVSYPRIRRMDTDRNGTTASALPPDPKRMASMQIEVAVLPAANATMEVETDSQTTVDIQSQGRVSNPAIGKYNVMLGAVSQIKCSVVSSSASRPVVPAMPAEVVPASNDEFPTISTELLLDGEVVQARTVIDFPKNTELGREIEIEADSLWLPIGSRWGDARLLEVKPGSTLSRRRYVLQWNDETRSTGVTSVSELNGEARSHQIATVWVPQQNQASTVLNVLFAECRDRRVRPGTLRYSRSSGAVWTLEGVNTWIPAINARERLDWPELSNAPIATSLRVPQSGGFGVLRRQVASGVAQARLANRWSVTEREDILTVRVDLLGSLGSESLQLQMPTGFVCQKAYTKSAAVPWLQSATSNGERVQLLFDRSLVDTNEVTVIATRPAPDSLSSSNENTNESTIKRPIPLAAIVGLSPIEQDLEVVVDPRWSVSLPADTPQYAAGVYAGRGDIEPTLKLPINSAAALSPLAFAARDRRNQGALVLEVQRLEDQSAYGLLHLYVNATPLTYPTIAIDIPTRLANYWSSEANIVTKTSSEIGRTWMIVPLQAVNGTLRDMTYSIQVQFDMPGDSDSDVALFKSIRPLDNDTVRCYLLNDRGTTNDSLVNEETEVPVSGVDESNVVTGEELAWLSSLMSLNDDEVLLRASEMNGAPVSSRESAIEILPQCKLAIHRALDSNLELPGLTVFESRYWIDPVGARNGVNQTLEFSVVPGVNVQSLFINGIPVPFEKHDGTVSCHFVHLGLASEVVLRSHVPSSRIDTNANGVADTVVALVPQLVGIEMERDIVVPRMIHRADDKSTVTSQNRAATLWNRTRDGKESADRANVAEWQLIRAEDFTRDVAELWLDMWNYSILRMKKAEVLMNRSAVLIEWEQYVESNAYNYLRLWAEQSGIARDDAYGEAVTKYHQLRKEIGMQSLQRGLHDNAEWLRSALANLDSHAGFEAQEHVFDYGTRYDAGYDAGDADSFVSSNPVGSPYRVSANRTGGLIGADSLSRIDWMSLIGCLMIVGIIVQIHRQMEQMLLDRPWWILTMLGVFAWLLTGSIVPAAALQFLSLLIAADSWWMVNERFRRTGIPVRR